MIDTSFKYGNEAAVGEGIRNSGVDRSEIFIASKFNKESHSVDGVLRAFDDSTRRLKVDHLDLFLIHWPVPWLDRYVDAWRGLVRLLEEKRVSAIGVSNFKPAHLQRIVDATGVVPDVNQIQLSPDIARVGPRAAHERLGTVTVAWSPTGRGDDLRQHPVVVDAAQRYGRSPTQIILRWHVQSGIVPIPRSSNPGRIAENADIFGFELDDDAMARLNSLDQGEGAARDSDSPANGH
ncbi:2,5-diketo-D-gluconate reductase A [Yonghaparkia alkaliphila]|uniref:2,5-diketo-D-gluconate reductase A n=2 Tax=Microcella alkalica TaxID=355930 RepID=A0A839E8I6_9MICO|nr:2,5-diketo-D-gluconate reductase A [Microcella alkalica]